MKTVRIMMIEDNQYKRDKAIKVLDLLQDESDIKIERVYVETFKSFQMQFNKFEYGYFDGYICDMQFPFSYGRSIDPKCGIKVLNTLTSELIKSPICVFSSNKDTEELIRLKGFDSQFIWFQSHISFKDSFRTFIKNVLEYKEKKDAYYGK